MEENRIPKRVLYMNFGTTRLRGRTKNRLQGGLREDGRIVGGEVWQEQLHNREEWKKLLRTARNCQILHMPMEWNELYKQIRTNNILVKEQYRFKINSSTEAATHIVINEILKAMNNRLPVGGIFWELEKAFVCVNHGITSR